MYHFLCPLVFFFQQQLKFKTLKTTTTMQNNANIPSVIIPENATIDERRAIYFNALYNLNVNDKVEKKDNLTYLSWAYAWAEFKKVYPSATYRVITNPDTHLPYFSDPNLGIIVMTEVTADDLTYQMWLPVMDGKNKAMKLQPYTYQVWDSYSKQYVEKTVNVATMFDINKTIMRTLVKNLSMFGLGLYIYAGEDLPEIQNTPENQQSMQTPVQSQQPTPQKRTYTKRTATTQQPQTPAPQPQLSQYDPYTGIKTELSQATDMTKLMALYQKYRTLVDTDPTVKSLFTQARINLTKAA